LFTSADTSYLSGKISNKILVLLSVLLGVITSRSYAQPTFSENFSSGNAAIFARWELNLDGAAIIPSSNSITNGTIPNIWTVGNVGPNNINPNDRCLHITCNQPVCNNGPNPQGTKYSAESVVNNSNVAVLLRNNVNLLPNKNYTLSFRYLAGTNSIPADAGGKLVYSVDNGITWQERVLIYRNQLVVAQEQIAITAANFPGYNNAAPVFRFGFRWFNRVDPGVNQNPGFVVDDIIIDTLVFGSNPTLTLNTVNPTEVCEGSNITITASSTDFPATGITYQVQLSDLGGNFNTPTILTQSSNLTFAPITIPANTLPGNYLLRISASNAITSNAVNLTIKRRPKAQISPNGPLAICSGNSTFLEAFPKTNVTYQWRRGNNANNLANIPNATADVLEVTTAGFYNVQIDSLGCSSFSNTVQITTGASPIAQIQIADNFPICRDLNGIGSTILRAIKNPNFSYQWFLNGNPILVNGNADTLIATFDGGYQVRVTDNTNGCSSVSTVKVGFSANQPNMPPNFAGLDSIKCSGDLVVAGIQSPGNQGVIFRWRPANNVLNFFTQQPDSTSSFVRIRLNSSALVPVKVKYRLVAISVAHGCSVQDEVEFTINPSPQNVTASPAFPQVCVNGNPVQLIGSPANTPNLPPPNVIGSGVFQGPPGTTQQGSNWFFNPNNNDNLVGTQEFTFIYTLNAQNGGPPCRNQATTTINVLPKPEVDAGRDTTFCSGVDSVRLRPITNIAGVWSAVLPSQAAFITSGGRIVPRTMPVGTYNFRFTATDANGCSNSDTRLITIRKQDTVTVPQSFQLCNNAAPRRLIGLPAGGAWTSSPPNLIDSAGNLVPTTLPVGLNNRFNYTLRKDGCVSTDSLFIFVITAPVAQLTQRFDTVCSKDAPKLLQGGIPEGGYWSGPGIDSLRTSFIPNSVAPGIVHTVYYVVEESGCKDSTARFIYVKQSPTAIAGPSEQTCVNSPRFRVTGFSPSTGGVWSGPGVDSAGFFTPNIQLVGQQRLRYLVRDNVGCADSAFKIVNVNPLPPVNAGIDTALCTGSSIRVGANPLPRLEYLWSSPIVGSLSPLNAANPFITLTNNTQEPDTFFYALRVRDSLTNCINRDTIRVIVYPRPISVVFFPGIKEKCQGDSILLRARTRAGLTYEWIRNGRSLNVPSSADSIFMARTSGTYRLVVRNEGAACTDTSLSDQLTFFPRFKPQILGPRYYCQDSTTQLSVSPADTNFTYQWQFAKNPPPRNITDSTNFTFTVGTIGFVRVILTTDKGCVDSSLVVKIDSVTRPFKRLLRDTSICEDGIATFVLPTGFQYRWKDTSGSVISVDETLVTNRAGLYYYEIFNQCRLLKDSVALLRVNPLPQFTVLAQAAQDTTICLNVPVRLRGPSGFVSYRWYSDGLSFNPLDGETSTLSTFNSDTLTDTVTLRVVDINKCSNTASAVIRVIDCEPLIYIPSAFTPQADGTNDLWRLRGYNINPDKIKVHVFNRWGEMVYYSDKWDKVLNEIIDPWDGTFKNVACPSGAYQYLVEFEGTYYGNTVKKRLNGTVTIIK
jgi:gliding motility-associated-like protein